MNIASLAKAIIKRILLLFKEILYTGINLAYLIVTWFREQSFRFEKVKPGSELLVLGTGPSLAADMDRILQSRKNTRAKLLCVNSFCISSLYDVLRPEYYLFVDPGYWNCTASKVSLNDRGIALSQIKARTHWPMMILLPSSAKGTNFAKELAESPFVTLSFFATRQYIVKQRLFKTQLYSINYFCPRLQNVLAGGIYLGLLMGYEKIEVFGADHSWHRDIVLGEDGNIYLEEKHFYEQEHSKRHRFETASGGRFTMASLFLAWSYVFKGYEELDVLSKYLKLRIVNMSSATFIDAFPRDLGEKREAK